ncbi:MAG TPA: alpha/beta fold hydrolase [Albitalea sp.]|uniref:alpha/beta hydrolase n=1 Tax=Piscinibacter sp. TaxID=1903157 RepID=UPI002ED5D9C7
MDRRTMLVGCMGATTTLLGACAEPFFFHPDAATYMPRRNLGATVEDIGFDSGGSTLHGWWMPAIGTARATVVHCHGNAANISNHARLVAWLPAEHINVLTFDYRGFGASEGTPSLNGVVEDTRAAIAAARRRAPGLPLVLFGQSLGGATAVRAAAEEDDIRLLVIEGAFAGYRDIVRDATRGTVLSVVALVASSTLPQRSGDPVNAMARLRMPVLVVHGDHDRVVPIEHSEQLYAAAAGPKRFVRVHDGAHLDAMTRPGIRKEFLAAVEQALSPSEPPRLRAGGDAPRARCASAGLERDDPLRGAAGRISGSGTAPLRDPAATADPPC